VDQFKRRPVPTRTWVWVHVDSCRWHTLIQAIYLLELELDCHLQVVHVPGVVMIDQGTDGLSRGVWMSDLHLHVDHGRLTTAVFNPAHEDMTLIHRCAEDVGLGSHKWSMSH
jgi:hypothetical protein